MGVSKDAFYRIEGPVFRDGTWVASVVLKELNSGVIEGVTQEEVHEQILRFLGQQAMELEKARIALRKDFEERSKEA